MKAFNGEGWSTVLRWRERLNLEKTSPHWTIGLLAYFFGLVTLPLFNVITLDDGVATLIGSALGAAVTVFGSLWVVQHQVGSRSRAFTRLVAETAAGMRDEAYSLVSLLSEEDWENNRIYAYQIQEQIERVVESFELFKQLSPFSDIDDYNARLLINRLQMKITKNLSIIEKEKDWLDKPTRPVLLNSRDNLIPPAIELQDCSTDVMTSLNHHKPLPSEATLRKEWSAMHPTPAAED